MRRIRHIVCPALVLALIIGSATCAFAAGYERVPLSGQSAAARETNPRTASGFVDAVKDASFVEKYPDMIDDAASFVKAVLGQFGLTGPKKP